ncbi:outer membrane protein assembly factor BamB family protein [Verrucomicrobiota bacterium sgz303538]
MNAPKLTVAALLFLSALTAYPADQPQWGEAWSRNMVSTETGLPASFDPQSGKNVRWVAKLGGESHSTPIVAGGRVYVGTNNAEPRDPKHQGDRGVLMCFDEKDGHLLWQLVVPKRDEDPFFDWPKSGLSSPVTVEGDRVYVVSSRGEVLCLDAHGLANGNDGPFRDEDAYITAPALEAPPTPQPGAEIVPSTTPPSAGVSKLLEPGPLDADILWRFDLVKDAGIWPHDGAHSSILIHGDHLYLNTGTGVDNTHRRIRRPDAPSLIVLDKNTGRLLARDDERIGPRIFHCTWSSPSLGTIDGREAIFFAGGDGVLRAFEPLPQNAKSGQSTTLKKIWQFDPDPTAPKEDVHRFTQNKQVSPSNVFGMPVFHDGRIFLAGGGDIWWGKNDAWLKSIRASGSDDVTSNAQIWSYPLTRHVMSTPAVYKDLVFIADTGRKLHCLDAATGQPLWTHEAKGDFWASPLVADGKIFIGTRRGDFWVFKATREKELLGTVEFGKPISATATAANGALYVATMTELFAFQEGAQPPQKAQ